MYYCGVMSTSSAQLSRAPGGVEVDRSVTPFRRFAFFTTVATYILIFVGGFVRVSGAGLGCPDWPTCFGRWIPPTDVSQLPPDIDPSLFNFTLAWIEWINRLIGMSVGLLIAATGVWAIIRYRKQRRIVVPAVLAAFLVAFQGWQGSVVVSSLLEPIVVTVHMLLALVIVSLLTYLTQQAYYLEHPAADRATQYPPATRAVTLLLWPLTLVQVGLGTQIRSVLDTLADRWPLLADTERLARVGWLNHSHLVLGILIALVTVVLGWRVLKSTVALSSLAHQAIVAMMVLVGVQILIGAGFIFAGIPAMVQVFHLWVATLYIGCLLLFYGTTGRARVA